MRVRIFSTIALAFITGCGGGDHGGPPGTPTRFLYASAYSGPNDFAAAIYGFAVFPGGLLSPVGSAAPTANGGGPIAITRDSKLLYTTTGSNGLSGSQIQADGSLAAAPAASTATSDNPIGLVAHPTADFLYVSGDSGSLSVFAINSATGALTLASSVTLMQTAENSAVLTPNGEFLYQDTVYPGTDSPTTGEIEGFASSGATGALSPAAGSPFPSTAPGTASLLQMAIDPGGRFLYVSYQYFVTNVGMDGGVAAYSIDANSGALTAVPGSPFAVGGVPVGLTIDASGKFLIAATYAALGGPEQNCLAVLSIDPGTGALAAVPGSPFGPLQSCGSVIADPTDPLVYAGTALTTSNSPATVAVLSIDPTTGALTPAASAGFPDQRLGVAFLALTH